MPNYSYTCKQCKLNLTFNRSINDVEEVPLCPVCEVNMFRDYTWGTTVFKGKGFYNTDKGDK